MLHLFYLPHRKLWNGVKYKKMKCLRLETNEIKKTKTKTTTESQQQTILYSFLTPTWSNHIFCYVSSSPLLFIYFSIYLIKKGRRKTLKTTSPTTLQEQHCKSRLHHQYVVVVLVALIIIMIWMSAVLMVDFHDAADQECKCESRPHTLNPALGRSSVQTVQYNVTKRSLNKLQLISIWNTVQWLTYPLQFHT